MQSTPTFSRDEIQRWKDSGIESVFWDLDETIIHAVYSNLLDFTQDHDELIVAHCCDACVALSESEHFIVYLNRPMLESVKISRDIFGDDNVKILTAATVDYANVMNRRLELGFHPHNILGREDVAHGTTLDTPHRSALIDNLPKLYNFDKVYFIGGDVEYKEITPFTGPTKQN